MLNGKVTIILLKKDVAQMSEYFPKPKSLGENVKVELDLSNYATKADLKNATRECNVNLMKKKMQLKSKVE